MGILNRLKAVLCGKTMKNYEEPAKPKGNLPVQPTVHEQLNEQLPDLNRRDLQYAREIGRWESIALQIQEINNKTAVLMERIPERVLTERSFGQTFGRGIGKIYGLYELIESLPELFIEQFNEQFVNRKGTIQGIEFMEKTLKSVQKCGVCGNDKIVELHHIDSNRDNNSPENLIYLCPNHHKMLHRGQAISDTKKMLEKITEILTREKLMAEELGQRIGLSRARANQILRALELENKVSKEKIGRRVYYRWAELSPDS